MSEVIALGYLGITASDLDAWHQFATGVLGMAEGTRPPAPPGVTTRYYRIDKRAWRLAVEQGADRGLAYVGYEVSDEAALEKVARQLESAGVAVKHAPELTSLRRVSGVVQASDPSGNPLEFFYGAKVEREQFVSPANTRFVTGDQGMGHVVHFVKDPRESLRFYRDVLGFRLTDEVVMNDAGPAMFGKRWYFLRTNGRHHTVAFGELPPEAPRMGIQHFMLQTTDLDSVGRALEKLAPQQLALSLGRHTNDGMVSFYCIAPSGVWIEYGYDGVTIDDDTWTTVEYDASNLWGHRPQGPAPRH